MAGSTPQNVLGRARADSFALILGQVCDLGKLKPRRVIGSEKRATRMGPRCEHSQFIVPMRTGRGLETGRAHPANPAARSWQGARASIASPGGLTFAGPTSYPRRFLTWPNDRA